MKVVCPVCGRMGFLEVRGNSGRVVHYVGFHEGKRVYERHTVKNVDYLRSSGEGLRGFKSHPPHHLREIRSAQNERNLSGE